VTLKELNEEPVCEMEALRRHGAKRAPESSVDLELVSYIMKHRAT
jgi:hypothetical protein